MSLPKLFFTISLLLFGTIGVLSVMKRSEKERLQKESIASSHSSQEVNLSDLQATHTREGSSIGTSSGAIVAQALSQFDDESMPIEKEPGAVVGTVESTLCRPVVIDHDDGVDAINTLFQKPAQSPIVETIRYTSKVSWKPKKSAWLIDYSQYYKTPLEFIYRSINSSTSKRDCSEKPVTVSEGMEFNVFRKNVDFHFYLVVSFISLKMRLYYILPHEKKAVFLKTYPICLGRKDAQKTSGCLTPFGLYQLGLKVMVFQPNMMGPYKGKRVEMIQVFGTRWMPFDREVDKSACTEPAKGFGIHGTPMKHTDDGNLVEDASSIGKYESDGCIRLRKKDIEELYSIISLRRAYVEVVPDFGHSRLMKGQM